MNNLKQKNVIYGRDLKDVLPHAGKGDSVVFAQNSNITDARLNNAFRQLVNNDLYVENALVAGMNYQPGPEGVQSEAAISALPDGSKRWVDSDDYTRPLQIYKKVETPLSQSIGLVRGAPVRFIAPVGDAVFVAFEDKLMYDKGAGLEECADSAGESVAATGYCDGDAGTFFVSDTSVYRLVQSAADAYELRKLNSGDMPGLKCVQYDAQDGMLYVGGDGGFMARGRCSSATESVKFVQDAKFCADDIYGGETDTNRYVDDITVNALQALDAKDSSVNAGNRQTNIVAATSGGMFRSDTRFFLDVKTSGSLAGKTCVGVAQHEGVVYALASDGHVYRQTDAENMAFSEYPRNKSFQSPSGLASHSSGLYVACGDGIYRYSKLGDDPVIDLECPVEGAAAVAVTALFGERMVFAASGGTVYYYSTPGKVRSIPFEGCSQIRQVVAQARYGKRDSLDVYVIGKDGAGSDKVFSAYVVFGSQKVEDGDKLDSTELVQKGVDSVAYGESYYYFKDRSIYDGQSGRSKTLGAFAVGQMEYSSGDGSIVMATDAGVQLLSSGNFDVIDQDSSVSGVKFASQQGPAVCFATSSDVYVAYKDGFGMNEPLLVGGVGVGREISGVATDGLKAYVFGADKGSVSGEISSASFYYVREASAGSHEEGERGTAYMDFPVMPFMAETAEGTALGISAGQAYRLAYDEEETVSPVSFPGLPDGTPINAFCMAGQHMFVATPDAVRQYDCSADMFDPGDSGSLVEISSASLSGVGRLMYSGQDTTFDMRIYAQSGENGLYMHTPGFNSVEKFSPGVEFSDFIMYVDHVEDEDEDQENDLYYAVMLGISSAGSNLYVISGLIGGAEEAWTGSPAAARELSSIDAETAGGPQFDRTPYQVFYTDDSKAYVAYTAKIREDEDLYADYILAIDTGDLLHTEIGDATDFAQLGQYRSLGEAGASRFTGFNIPSDDEDGEDIDVLATCYRDEISGYVLATFKVDVNIPGQKIADVCNREYFQSDLSYKCFQPDCARLGSDEYIAVPAVAPGGSSLSVYVFKYNRAFNSCSLLGRAGVDGIGSAEISAVYLSRFLRESPDAFELVVVGADGRAFYVETGIDQSVQWETRTEILGGAQFLRVVRCGINQLVGFDRARGFVYDFQSRTKNELTDGFISNIYATDAESARNYMLVQHVGDKKLYSIDPSRDLNFEQVTGLGEDRKTLLKANNSVFVVAWGETKKIIYRENAGGFVEIAEGRADAPSGDEYTDAQIFYGVVLERSAEPDYYAFFLRRSGIIDVYAMSGDGSPKTLQKMCEFDGSGENICFSHIQYAGSGSAFDAYTRVTAYNGVDHYDWPIFMRASAAAQEYIYLDFASSPQMRCAQLLPLGGTDGCVGLGKSGETLYYVKATGEGAGKTAKVYSVDGGEIASCGGSSRAWLAGGTCFFQKVSGGIRYYDGDMWRDVGDGQYESVHMAGDGRYYFVKSENGKRDLYEGASIPAYPVAAGPAFSEITYVGLNEPAPVRLAAGDAYAGLVCQDDVGTRYLCIMWPTDEYSSDPTADGDGPDGGGSYSVYACQASFSEFPDGRDNPAEIVPLGDFLDEVIAYEGGYLHVARVTKSKLITNASGTSFVPVVSTLPWTELGAAFGEGVRASAKSGGRRYVASETGLSSFPDGSSGLVMKILSVPMKADGVDARSFCQTGQNAFLVATDRGVYRYQHVEGEPVVRRISSGEGYDAAQIVSYNFSGGVDAYLMANALDGYIYGSENCRVWKKQFRPAPASALLRAVYPQNAREWYFGASTGLYKSTYKYEEVDDLVKFAEDDLYSLYAEMLTSDISARSDDEMERHELDPSYALGHLSSLVHDVNQNLLGADFDGLQSSGWQHHTNTYSAEEYSVSNDIVFEQFWGDNADWNLSLSAENQFVSAANVKFTYLLRRWMSGITELYVHVPTTNTYYVNHVPSTPNYHIDEDSAELSAANVTQFGRDKTVFRHDPNRPGVYTTMRLAVNKSAFSIDQVLDVQACGNSLPLKIYKETVRENGSDNDFEAAQYFNSYVAPTVLMSTDNPPDGDDYIFNFACFGADEQVIKLQFIDDINRFDQSYCRLVFDSSGLDSDPDSFVKQRIRLDGQPYALRRNQYRWPQDQRLFAGWTFTPSPKVNPDVSELNGFYSDRQQITSTEIVDRCGPVRSGQDVKLYAVWITYQFGAGDTTLLMSPSAGKTTFRLGSVGMIDDERIGEKLIVKFEEVE